MSPKLIIHGGATSASTSSKSQTKSAEALSEILQSAYGVLTEEGARAAVLMAVRMLEDNPLFNAGYGSCLQKDEKARMSAALIDSVTGKFSGVINIENIQHPIDVAEILSWEKHTVLAGERATEFARNRGFKSFNPVTPLRLEQFRKKVKGESGTVGAVALDARGIICAGTSTGGVGYETPGRVSDSATVAGTYASKYCGISCTGRGEKIVDYAIAAKVVGRVEGGVALQKAILPEMKRASAENVQLGLIGISSKGDVRVGESKGTLVVHAFHDGKNFKTFLD